MRHYTSCIQAISAFITALATILLGIVTFFYVRETRRMAKSMKAQADLMQLIFEMNVAPLVSFYFTVYSVNSEKGIFQYNVRNEGKEIFTIKKIKYIIWNEDNPDNLLYSKEEHLNLRVISNRMQSDTIEVTFPSQVAEILKITQDRKKVKYQGFALIEDVLGRETKAQDTFRTLWS